MPRWMRFSLVALLLAIPMAWGLLRTSSEPPPASVPTPAPAPAPAPVAAAPVIPTAPPVPSTADWVPPEPEQDDEEVAEEEDEEEPEGPCISVEVTANGAPVPGARVTAAQLVDEDSYSSEDPLELGPDGRGLSWCEPGTYLLAAHAPGFAPRILTVVEPAMGPPRVARFRLEPGLTVSGHVLDKDSQQPIAEAKLTLTPVGDFAVKDSESVLEESSFTTDAQGAFRLGELLAGSYRVVVEAPGHSPTALDLSAPRPEHLSIELEGTSRLEGMVVDSEGAPVPGAGIWTSRAATLDKYAPRTDDEGHFSFDVPEGIYSLGARFRDQLGLYEHKVTVVRGGLVDGLVIRLKPSGAVSGKVFMQASQQPVERAHISLHHHDTGWTFSDTTNAKGAFRLDHVLPGEYRLVASKHTMPDVIRERVLIQAGQELTVELPVVQFATLEGHLKDGLGHPVEGESVHALPLDVPPTERRIQFTPSDEKGHYSFDNLPPGRYRLSARCAANTPELTHELTLQGGEAARFDFAFPEAMGRVEGIVQAAGGGPPRHPVLVSVTQGENSGSESKNPEDSGEFSFRLLPGSYTLSAAYSAADDPGPEQRVSVEAGKIVRVRLTVLNSVVETRGIVLDSRGEPAPGASLKLVGEELYASDSADEKGRFTLQSPSGKSGSTATLAAESEAEEGELPNVRVGSSGVVVRLQKSSGVRGRVVAVRGPPVQGFELGTRRRHERYWETLRNPLPYAGDTFEHLDLPSGELQFLVRTTDGRSGKAEVRVTPGQTGTVEVRVGELGRVTGRVLNPLGEPRPGWVHLDKGTRQQLDVFADEDGRFEFFAVEPGAHVLDSDSEVTSTFTLREGETLDLGPLREELPPLPPVRILQ